MEIIVGIIILVITTIYLWIRYKLSYWQRRKVDTVTVRDLYGRNKRHVAFIAQEIYNQMKMDNKLYVGVYNLLSPALIIRDLEIVRNVFITDFDAFPDRGLYSNPHNDPLSTNLVRLSGDVWKKMRQKLTPTFTSGKMKVMFPTVAAIGERFIKVVREEMEICHNELELKDLCARFTTDVIGSVAFGLECNSLRDPHNEFRVKGDKAFHVHPVLDALASSYPSFFHKLGYKAFTSELIEFYSQIVRKNVELRERSGLKRNDFLDILIELKNHKREEDKGDFYLEMQDVIAQAFVFFIGGFETSSSTMSIALFELARNPGVQQKARDNVLEVLELHQGVFSYESLNEMHYIKQVVQETLRKNPVAPSLRRVCRSTCILPTPEQLVIEPGVSVIIPVYAIHHDPDYYAEPHRFVPERFDPGCKDARHPVSYLPFGVGPRICIAERFGIMQVMIGVALLLKHFKFSISERSPQNLEFDPNNMRIFTVKGGIYLKVESI